ncbi:Wzz/FepE/Etk N-terminal domain-containing protein [Methylobacterium sp. J-067]|uniref:Wzz/FepE/Etk N-terminal domain-containing protein n=1 Tax=Methylobacterium sp. J-067 TaxID=2836648 RepID=UPI001FB89BE5|nr:Wzz/FepE/Etk N-terminal domain-containing protein [Methylobacterium sp. J-067]MCJ2023083.1 hypothetical protein [Methylobacterium sp. J-067]
MGGRSLREASATIGATLVLVRRKLPFLAIWVAGFVVCGAIYSHVLRPDFIATTQILLQPRVVVNDGPEALRHFEQLKIDGEQCETELRILRSEMLLYQVFKALKINNNPDVFAKPDGLWSFLGSNVDKVVSIIAPENDYLRAFYAFASRMRSRRLGLSYVIEISYRAPSAEQAVRVVNSIASAYAVYRIKGVLVREQGRGVYRQERLETLQAQLLAAEAGMRFGTIPDGNLADADVRLLGPADLPLGSVYPRMGPIVLFMALFGVISGLLIVIVLQDVPAPARRPAGIPKYLDRSRIA